MPYGAERKRGESITFHVPGLQDPIVVTVLELRQKRAKLGVVAPGEVRFELTDQDRDPVKHFREGQR